MMICNSSEISIHYEDYKRRIVALNIYNPDVLHDSFLSMCNDDVIHWKDFIKTYKKHYSRSINDAMQYVSPDPLFWELLPDCEPQEQKIEPIITSEKLDRELRLLLSKADYQLVNMRYKLSMSLQEIAMYLGKGIKAIADSLQKVMERIINHFNPQTAV